jgi:hypothetical protein
MTAALSSTHSSSGASRAVRPVRRPRATRRENVTSLLVVLVLLALPGAAESHAQSRPRPALSERDARRAIAATPGFELATGAIKVREVSPRGVAPVRVVAEVKLGVRFERVEDEAAQQNAGIFKQRRWRAVQLRTADRRWDDFDLISEAMTAGLVEPARQALEELADEFEARVLAASESGKDGDSGKVEPVTRGPLRLDSLSALGSSAVGEVAVETEFTLDRGVGGWRVAEFAIAGVPGGDPGAHLPALDGVRAARARAELEEVRAALERYRAERGRYVAAADFDVLMDHLHPRFINRVVRFDPWHRAYLYAVTAAGFSLSSTGPDGRAGTNDDVRASAAR